MEIGLDMDEVSAFLMRLGVQEVLGYLCIFANGLSKLPQIRRVHETQSVAGLSLTSILLELYCHGMLTGFHLAEGYPYTQFLEYPLLVHLHRIHGRWCRSKVPHVTGNEREHPVGSE